MAWLAPAERSIDDALRRGPDARRYPAAIGALVRRLETERDRWFLWLPVLYGVGAGLYFQQFAEPTLALALMPVPIALVAWILLQRGTVAVVAASALLAIALGFAAAKLRTTWVSAPVLERSLNLVTVSGWVELVEPRAGRGQRITLRVAEMRGIAAERRPHRVRVRTMVTHGGLKPGDPIRLRATLAPPAIPALPGAFDFARQAFFQRIGGVGYTLSRPEMDEAIGPAPLILRFESHVTRLRQAISARVREALPGERGALADAMITGERGGISEATNDAYRDSGLFHILSISGLHMTVMAGTVFLALRLALAAIPAIALRIEVKKWSAVAATLVALGYLMISGGAFATVRAWVMISIMFLAILLDRPALALRNVAVSALIILLVLPESLLDVGFQMSFAAVVSLVAAYEAHGRWRSQNRQGATERGPITGAVLFLGAIVATTLIASAAVAPFAAYHFHKSQQYAVLANLIAIPVCNVIVMPGVLATLLLMPLGLESLPLWVMAIGLDVMNWVAVKVAALPGAVGRIPAIPQSAFLLMAAGGLWLCIWQTRWRLLGIAAVAAGVAVSPTLARPDILVGRDGQVVAVRGNDGRLSALGPRNTWFELGRWLEHDGDGRPPREIAVEPKGFRCDAAGCIARAGKVQVSLVREPSALAEDCQQAGLLILTLPLPAACKTTAPTIDIYALRDQGTHAVYIEGERLRVVTVAQTRGARPWTASRMRQATASQSGTKTTGGQTGSRIGMFASPYDLLGEDTRRRPEVEDEDDEYFQSR